MGKDNKPFGKVTGSLDGFTVRMQINNNKRTHTGKFGIYAGKTLVEEVTSTKEGLEKITPEFIENWRKKKQVSKNR